MKIKFTLPAVLTLVLAIFTNNANAQQACTWAKKAGGTAEDWGANVATDNAGNVYYLGSFTSQTITIGTTTLYNQPYQAFNFGEEMFLAKYDSCGNFKWAKSAGGDAETIGRGLACDASGNVFVTGYTFADTLHFGTSPIYLAGTNYVDIFVAKYDGTGNVLWAKQGTGNYQDYAFALTVDGAGSVYVTGSFTSDYLRFGTDSVVNQYGNNDGDVFIAKFDNSTGACQWLRAGSGNYDDYGYGISTDAAGNVYVTGTYGSAYIRFGNDSLALSPSGYYDIFTVKYDGLGNEQWLRAAGDAYNDQAWSIATDAAGNSYITGFIGDNSTVNFGNGQSITNTMPSYNFFITKYDNAGTAQWARTASCDAFTTNRGYRVKLDASGNPYVIGFYNSDSLDLGPVTLTNTSITGGAQSGGDTAYDVMVMKYKANGNLQWARTVGGDDHEFGYGIAPGPNHSLYICGEYTSTSFVVSGFTLTASNTNGNAFIANNINTSNETASICLVTSDSLSVNNIVYWDKTPYTDVDSFIVYREVSTNVYARIGAQSYSTLSQFADTARHIGPANGDPNIGTYRYKLQTLDTAGNLGKMSPYHNTVFFVDNGGGVFTWNTYQVENATTPVVTFNLVRDNLHNGNYINIGTVAGTQTTLSDPAYATYSLTADWRVEATGFNCTPTARQTNGTLGAVIKSKSNITNNRGVGISEVAGTGKMTLYPNPANNSFTLESTKELGLVCIYNTMGQVALQLQSRNLREQVDISSLPAGIYTVRSQGRFIKLVKE